MFGIDKMACSEELAMLSNPLKRFISGAIKLTKSRLRMKPLQKRMMFSSLGMFLIFGSLAGAYVFSILWRVSLAEHQVMGKDLMLHVFHSDKQFDCHPTIDSYMAATFKQNYKTLSFPVWRDKINGFQHTYGSALAAYEWGEFLSDKLFVANEFAEWLFDKDGVSERDLRDRHRDLANNKTGRKIGVAAFNEGLQGRDADEYIRDHIVIAIEYDREVITHWRDPIIDTLPSEAAMGCPYLPRKNGYDCIRIARQKVTKTRARIARRLHYYWNKVEGLIT